MNSALNSSCHTLRWEPAWRSFWRKLDHPNPSSCRRNEFHPEVFNHPWPEGHSLLIYLPTGSCHKTMTKKHYTFLKICIELQVRKYFFGLSIMIWAKVRLNVFLVKVLNVVKCGVPKYKIFSWKHCHLSFKVEDHFAVSLMFTPRRVF